MAEIVGVHGIQGTLKLKVFSEADLMDYAPLCDAEGKPKFDLLTLQPHQNIFLATLKGVSDRDAAEKMRGTKLYVPRDQLPKIEDEGTYYHIDLIGLAVKNPEGQAFGAIVNVVNFGAGDLLEIKPFKGPTYYLPFTKANVPHVDIARGEATVIVPEGLVD